MTAKLMHSSHAAGMLAGTHSPSLDGLPPVLDLPTAARLLGIGRTTAYQLVRADAWPTRVLRLGRQIRIPTAQLLDLISSSPRWPER